MLNFKKQINFIHGDYKLEAFKKLNNLLDWLFIPLLALYGAFELYGFLGLVLVLSYILVVFTSIVLYYDSKRRKIAPKGYNDEEYEDYDKKVIMIDLGELKAVVFMWFIPISSFVIIYLYFQVEYGILFALLYILFYAYKTQLNLEVLNTVHNNREYYPTTKDGSSMDELKERIEILQNRLDKLYDLSGFDAVKLLEIDANKKRVAIIQKLWDIDLENNWIEKLWQWADLVGVSDYDMPRSKDKLLQDISYGLIYLDFENMDISTISPEIGYFHTATTLNCSMNNLVEIPKSIANITDLEILNLRLNELKYIPPEFENLKNLRSLDLSSNRITGIPIEVTDIQYLEELILHNNPIVQLPNELSKMKYLKKVTIDSNVEVSSETREFLGNKLETIDTGWIQGLWDWADAGKLHENLIPRNKEDLLNLESLDLCSNNFQDSSSCNENSNLACIDIHNNISKLPKEIGNLIKLKKLSISYTKITRLPKEIGNLINLELLSVSHTNIAELPKEVGRFKKLKKLVISNTNIVEMPIEIKNLSDLEIC